MSTEPLRISVVVSLVHFMGHGVEDGRLLLEADDGNADPLSPKRLAEAMREASVRLTLLSACHSGAAGCALLSTLATMRPRRETGTPGRSSRATTSASTESSPMTGRWWMGFPRLATRSCAHRRPGVP